MDFSQLLVQKTDTIVGNWIEAVRQDVPIDVQALINNCLEA